MTHSLCDHDVDALLEGYAQAAFDPVDVVQACLDRIARFDGAVLATMNLREDAALAEARDAAERWRSRQARPLEGVPIALKDMIDIAGSPTTGGSRALSRNVATHDAEVVRRLRAAGAVVIAKLATSPFAFADPVTADYETTRNPWSLDRFPGGTSTGPGAALALRMAPIAVGTDSAGSVRIPAAHCGVVGMKPTFGAISRHGVLPSTWSFDTIGIMGRSASGVGRVLRHAVGPDRRDPAAQGHLALGAQADGPVLPGLRVGVLRGVFTALCSAAAAAAFDQALAELEAKGAELIELDLPMIDLAEDIAWPIVASEFASSHEALEGQDVNYGPALKGFLAYGRRVPAVDYLRCQRLRVRFQQEVKRVIRKVDVVVSPTVQTVAPTLAGMTSPTRAGETPWFDVAAKNTLPFSLSGMPAISIPIGRADLDLPFGLQIAADHGADAIVLAVAEAIQARTAHHLETPAILNDAAASS